MSEALISQESAKIVHEVHLFLQSTVVDMEISNENEKKNAVTLGNELQKKFSVIEKARKAEKGIWDAKAKAVQEEFKPVLDLIIEKKNALGRAITVYNQKLEIERQQRQKELEEAAQKERDRLEKLAGSREERRQMYAKKYAEVLEKLRTENDYNAQLLLAREANYYESKVREFTEKAAVSQQQAASVTTPIYVPEAPTASKGTRVTMEATVAVRDMRLFVMWALEHGELQYLTVDEAKLKNRCKEKEGMNPPPGVEWSWLPKTGFSGK